MDTMYTFPCLVSSPRWATADKWRLENCHTVGNRSNGFASGPAGVEVIDPTQPAYCQAYDHDSVGRQGRSWYVVAEFHPTTGWVPLDRPTR